MRLSRRSTLLGLAGVAAGSGALVTSGAFTSVTAERSISVTTAGDQSANLRMEPINSPNGNEYAETDSGTLSITIPDVNLNAVTHIDDVFKVTNSGSQSIVVYFEEQGGDSTAAVDIGAKLDQGFETLSSVGGGEQPTSDGIADTDLIDISTPSPPGYDNIGVLLESGMSLDVGIYIDTSDANLNDELGESPSVNLNAGQTLLDGITVHASATAVDNGNYYAKRQNN